MKTSFIEDDTETTSCYVRTEEENPGTYRFQNLWTTPDGSYKISYFAKETGTCQTSVKINGQHVRGSPFKTEFIPRLFKPVFSFGKQGSAPGMFSWPWGIAVNDKDEIAVTNSDNHRIQIYFSDGTHLRSFGRKSNQQGQFNWPNGITFYSQSSRKRTPSGRDKNVRDWSWPLTRMVLVSGH